MHDSCQSGKAHLFFYHLWMDCAYCYLRILMSCSSRPLAGGIEMHTFFLELFIILIFIIHSLTLNSEKLPVNMLFTFKKCEMFRENLII